MALVGVDDSAAAEARGGSRVRVRRWSARSSVGGKPEKKYTVRRQSFRFPLKVTNRGFYCHGHACIGVRI